MARKRLRSIDVPSQLELIAVLSAATHDRFHAALAEVA